MKIQEVTIEGYQSHTNSTFCLSPGLTVITGPSDAGKTAIIRALRWFAFNEPTGEAFLHTIRNPDGSVKEAVDQVKVSVTFDNGITITKTRRKGKTTYTHSAFPTAWEKAEIPPEIKETLGLVKQQYGDFETCLNFAFQLDAPFMLSESASVGAKVLGKLAGTEIVDKSISEVNKKTHQTRNDISYADKQIGEIDVSLTEYFDLDRFDAELKIAEAAFTKLKEDQSRHVALTALMNSYQLNTEQRIKYYDEVERLAGVVVASVSLGIAEREQAKKEKLEDLNVGFWKAVQDQNEPLRVIHITRNLEDLQADLKEVETDVIRYDALLGFQYGYINLQETIRRTSALVVKLDQAVGLSFMLDEAEKDTQALEAMERAYKRFNEVSEEERDLRYKVYLDPKAYEGYGYGKAPGGAVVTVITGTPYDINISAHVEYEKNVDRAEVLQQFTELVTEYVKSRVFNRNDDTKELSPIAYKKIAAILGTLSGVANYDDLTVNGGTADITIEPYEIPTVKKVSLT